MSSPSNRNTWQTLALHSRAALCAIVLNTGWTSAGELEITRRISLVAVCCARASASSRACRSGCACSSATEERQSRPAAGSLRRVRFVVLRRSAFIKHSPDDSEASVDSSDFTASLEARTRDVRVYQQLGQPERRSRACLAIF